MKTCSKCKQELDETQFYKNRSRYDGLQNICKDCCTSDLFKLKKELKSKGIKICSKCKRELDESQFYKYKNSKDGLTSYCKDCSHTNNRNTCNKTKEKNVNSENIIKEKKCTQCEELKKIEHFSINKNRKDGYNNWCKDCVNSYGKDIYRKNNKEKLKEKAKSDHIKRYSNNREKELNRAKIYKQNNKEKIEQYRKKNQNKTNQYYRIYFKNKRQEDINFRIRENYRRRLNYALNKNQKKGHTIDLLNCSIDFYKIYLSEKFTSEMSWENYGSVWEIDHIIPCASFKHLDTLEEQQKCFNYKNTQPLLIHDNRSKNAKLNWSKS